MIKLPLWAKKLCAKAVDDEIIELRAHLFKLEQIIIRQNMQIHSAAQLLTNKPQQQPKDPLAEELDNITFDHNR